MYQSLALLAGFLLVYSLIAARVERTWVSGAMIFTIFGVLIGPIGLDLLAVTVRGETLRTLAELTLALVLFSDAANTDLRKLRRARALPIRLLVIGLPITIGLGIALGAGLFRGLSWVEIALLATMVAPTDAALGKAVVSNPAVPETIREGLTVESGLNDGICVPLILLFLALIEGPVTGTRGTALAVHLFAEEIGIGAAVGIASALLGAMLIRVVVSKRWVESAWDQVPVVALAFLCFGAAQWAGVSGFIAAFVGGLVFGTQIRGYREPVLRAAEGTGNALSGITWIVFGAAVIGRMDRAFDPAALAYAALSLTVVRVVPVMIALIGYRATVEEKLFIGWFGPRGLASIVFGLIVVDADLAHGATLTTVVVYAVVLSILLHGVTANPWARALGGRERARAA